MKRGCSRFSTGTVPICGRCCPVGGTKSPATPSRKSRRAGVTLESADKKQTVRIESRRRDCGRKTASGSWPARARCRPRARFGQRAGRRTVRAGGDAGRRRVSASAAKRRFEKTHATTRKGIKMKKIILSLITHWRCGTAAFGQPRNRRRRPDEQRRQPPPDQAGAGRRRRRQPDRMPARRRRAGPGRRRRAAPPDAGGNRAGGKPARRVHGHSAEGQCAGSRRNIQSAFMPPAQARARIQTI